MALTAFYYYSRL